MLTTLLVILIISNTSFSYSSILKVRHFSLQELMEEHGGFDLAKDSAGYFTSFYQDGCESAMLLNTAKTWLGTIRVYRKYDAHIISINKDRYRINNYVAKPYGDTVGQYWFQPYGPVYIHTTSRDTFVVFESGHYRCNGSGCLISFLFIINTRLKAINIYEYDGLFNARWLFCDDNSDGNPEFYYPTILTDNRRERADYEMTERIALLPFIQDERGNFVPENDTTGHEVRFTYYADFQNFNSTNDKFYRKEK